jgi:hypothetical protein
MGTAQAASVDIILTPDASAPNGIRFEMSSSFKNGNELTFKNPKKGDWFDIDFNIVDQDDTGYLFPDDPEKAMYVKPVDNVTDPCPENWDDPQHWDQFQAKKVTKGHRTLEVKNLNETIQLYKFCLWFTKSPKDNGPCIPYDPIGSNQNAGSNRSFAMLSPINLAIGTATVAVVVLAAYEFGLLGF